MYFCILGKKTFIVEQIEKNISFFIFSRFTIEIKYKNEITLFRNKFLQKALKSSLKIILFNPKQLVFFEYLIKFFLILQNEYYLKINLMYFSIY